MYCDSDDVTVKCSDAVLYRYSIIINACSLCRGGDGTMMYILWTIILSGVGTLILRITPFIAISKLELSDRIIQWLSFIPITLFTALVVDGFIIQQQGQWGYQFNWIFLWSALPTVLVALLSRSLTVTVIIGIVTVAILRLFMSY